MDAPSSLGALYPPHRVTHPEPLVARPVHCLLPIQALLQRPSGVRRSTVLLHWQKPTQAYLGKIEQRQT